MKKVKGKCIEVRKCLSCGEIWNVTPKTTNICSVCNGKQSVMYAEFCPNRYLSNK